MPNILLTLIRSTTVLICIVACSTTHAGDNYISTDDSATTVAAAKTNQQLPSGMEITKSGVLIKGDSGIQLREVSGAKMEFKGLNAKGHLICECGGGKCTFQVEKTDLGDRVKCTGDQCCNLRMMSGVKGQEIKIGMAVPPRVSTAGCNNAPRVVLAGH